jgi:hypothetical protein
VQWTICHELDCSSYNQFAIMGKYSLFYIEFCLLYQSYFVLFVNMFGVVSLMTGSTIGVPMSPRYAGYQSTSVK